MGAIAPLIGGWLTVAVSYQSMFILAAVIGVTSLALLRFGVCEPRQVKVQSSPAEAIPTSESTLNQ